MIFQVGFVLFLYFMGSACCKPSAIEDSRESPRERLSSKTLSDLRVPRVTSSRREEGYRVKDRLDNNDGRAMLIDKQVNGSVRLHGEKFERKREKAEFIVSMHHPGLGSIPKAMEGEQVAAGWPAWLAAVAGEAIKGWLPRRADSFEKLDKVCNLSLLEKIGTSSIINFIVPVLFCLLEIFSNYEGVQWNLVYLLMGFDFT